MKDEIKTCEMDCKIYGTRMCREDGNTTFGYEEHGAEVCPVFMPRDQARGEDKPERGRALGNKSGSESGLS